VEVKKVEGENKNEKKGDKEAPSVGQVRNYQLFHKHLVLELPP
jgi:hypothetical protein